MSYQSHCAIAVLLCTTLLGAASTASDPRGEELDRLIGMTLRSPFLAEAAVELLDGVGGRVSGSPNGADAERLAATMFRSAGVPLVRKETFTVPHWQVERADVTLMEPARHRVRAVALANCAPTPADGVQLSVVDAGYGTGDEVSALGDTVVGAAVLARTGAPEGHRWIHRTEKYRVAVAAGAAAFLYAPEDPEGSLRAGTITLDGRRGSIPALSIPQYAAAWMERSLTRGKQPVVRVTVLAERDQAEAANIVADLPGRRAEEVVLVGAHLDSWDLGQGAGDNGTGTLALWQTARTLVEQGSRPLRTIRFVSFMGEEIGLLGSGAYVERHAEELDRIRAMVNLDMVGEPVGFGHMVQPGLEPLLVSLASKLGGMGLRTDVTTGVHVYGDHGPFLLRGVPIVTFRSRLPEAVRSAYHTEHDTLERLELGQLSRAAAVSSALIWTLANADPLPTHTLELPAVRSALEEAGAVVPAADDHTEADTAS